MPIYEYKCKCGHKFEEFQKVGENGSGLHCPKCLAENPEKIFSTFAPANAENSISLPQAGSQCSSCCNNGYGCGM